MNRNKWGWIPLLVGLSACAPGVAVRPPSGSEVQVLLSKSEVMPGHTLRISARSQRPGSALQVSGWDQTAVLAPVPDAPGESEGFLAVPLDAAPGRVKLDVAAAGPGGHPFFSVPVTVVPRPPDPTARLNVRNFETLPYAPESQRMREARAQAGDFPGPRLAPWPWPVRGRLSERFGAIRIYNGGLGSWPHGGYDIAAPEGALVLAPADGRVILTAAFRAHGNTILLDHGYGVITTYLHLSAIHVQPGDRVRRGQAIGAVGSTGGSTAPHLHFQVNVNGRIAEPGDFLAGE